jgi:putative acetyltransferase
MFEMRLEIDSDRKAILAVNRAAFEGDSEADLLELLWSESKVVISLVTVIEGRTVGHVAFTRVVITGDASGRRVCGLAPLSVHPEFQGRGVGSALVRRGIEECRSLGVDGLVVLGEPGYYSRFGFEKASLVGLSNDYDADESFMVIGLRDGALEGMTGKATYEPAFSQIGA